MGSATSRQAGQRTCLSISEAIETRREKKSAARRQGPQPWIVRKMTIGLVISIVAFTTYVYVGRLCVPSILQQDKAITSFGTGVALLVAFSLLWLMLMWSYIKVVTTPPGFAKDHVPQTPPPMSTFPPTPPAIGSRGSRHWTSSTDSTVGVPYDEVAMSYTNFRPNSSDRQSTTSTPTPNYKPSFSSTAEEERSTAGTLPHRDSSTAGPSRGIERPSVSSSTKAIKYTERSRHIQDTHTRTSTASTQRSGRIPSPIQAHLSPHDIERQTRIPEHETSRVPTHETSDFPNSQPDRRVSADLPPPLLSRRPPTHPVLSPEYRYCTRDGLVKPMRCHHCRACGTCVLMYDHHCPWIGQCVGAWNRKFFVNFLQWCSVFALYIFSSVIGLTAGGGKTDFDGFYIAIIVIAAVFGLFTTSLLISHIYLILYNTSTLERYAMSSMQKRENGVLNTMFSIWDYSKRREEKRKWNAEWGRIGREGNIWWLGNMKLNWEYIMGSSIWGWFLPVGRSQGDGVVYPVNPRFDSEGRWRRRSEWPQELQ